MEENERERVFSIPIKAGKRTYFFDVKKTRAGEQYLNITESKKVFDNRLGKFFFEKHTLFLYKEDFEKFYNGLGATLQFIETGVIPEQYREELKKEDSFQDSENDLIENSKLED